MKLLFGKVGADASQELKEALSFIDADFKLPKLKADIRTATKDLIQVIGQAVYDEIVTAYEDESAVEDDVEMLELGRYAVITDAYRKFAPSNDLQHGKNGRKMLTDEDSKTPFQHLLVADNDELERRCYRAMDDLLDFLDAKSDSWKASDNFKDSKVLFVSSTKMFDQYHVMGSRLLFLKLQPDMKYIEQRAILPRIGKDVFDSIKLKLSTDVEDQFTEEEKAYMPLIREAVVNGSLMRGVRRLNGKLFPDGLLNVGRSDSANIKVRSAFESMQVDAAIAFYKETLDRVLLDIEAVELTYHPIVIAAEDLEEDLNLYEVGKDDKYFNL